MLAHTIETDLFGFDGRTLEQRVRKFASGVLSPAIWEGYRKAGKPMCIAASETGDAALERACEFVRNGGELLVDSGAFMFRQRPDETPWEAIIYVYRRIARAATGTVTFILPDVVGSQEKTLYVLQTWGDAVMDAIKPHHHALLPVQTGAMSPGAFVKAALLCLTERMDGLALPSNAAAFPSDLIPALAEVPEIVPRRVHFLGISRNSKGLQERLVRLETVWPKAEVSCDACEHRALVGQGKPVTEARRAALADYWDDRLEHWDDTEDDGTDERALEALKARFPDADSDDLEAMLCSQWGALAALAQQHDTHARMDGPKATTQSIYRYATGQLDHQSF